MGNKIVHDYILGRKRSDLGFGDRIATLEDMYVTDEWYASVSAGTGVISPPTGAEFVMDSWPENIDAVVSTESAGGLPDIEHARAADGSIVTTTLDAAGNYVLSDDPTVWPADIIFRYRTMLKDYDYTKSLNAFKLEDYDQNHIVFNINPTSPPTREGAMFWGDDTHMPAVKSDIAGATMDLGLEDWVRVKNNTGGPLADGAAITASGVAGEHYFEIKTALATPGNVSVIGILTTALADGAEGWAVTRGYVHDYDTTGWPSSAPVYLSATVSGALTIVAPTPPSYELPVGFVGDVGVAGSIFVFVDNPIALIDATDAAVASGDPTGWHDEESITIEYDSTTRKITLTGDLKYSWRGQVKELTSPWVSDAHDNTLDTAFFLYSTDGITFAWSTTPWSFSQMQVAYVSYGTTDKVALRELHGLMPWQAHEEFHQTVGTYKSSGGDLASYVIDSTTAADRRPTVAAMNVKDEDIRTTNPSLTSSLYTKAFLSGTGDLDFTVETADIVPLLAANPYYNQFVDPNWVQTLVPQNSYMSVWLIGVPASDDSTSQKYRYLWMQGQTAGTLLGQQSLTPSDLSLGAVAALFTEFVFSAQLILRYTAGNWHIAEVVNLTGTRANSVGSPAGNYLSAVTTDATLTGNGTAGDPLSVVDSGGGILSWISTTTIVPGDSAQAFGFTVDKTKKYVILINPFGGGTAANNQIFFQAYDDGGITPLTGVCSSHAESLSSAAAIPYASTVVASGNRGNLMASGGCNMIVTVELGWEDGVWAVSVVSRGAGTTTVAAKKDCGGLITDATGAVNFFEIFVTAQAFGNVKAYFYEATYD